MKTINKIGKKISASINSIFDVVEYAARLALLIGAVVYIISLIFRIGTLETYSLATLIGATLFLIPAQIYDIKYYVEQTHYHVERLDYMMYHSVYRYEKDE